MNRVLIDPTREQFWDAMFQGGIDSWWDMGNARDRVGRTGPGAIWKNPENRLFPFPYDRGAAWRVSNSDYGHWQKRRASGGRDRRDVALAWWTAEDGRKFVRVVGRYRNRNRRHGGLQDWQPFFDGIPEGAAPHAWVWPRAEEFVDYFGLRRDLVAGMAGGGFDSRAISAGLLGDNYGDPVAWLIAADWLEEHGRDLATIRRLFQPGFAAEDDARRVEELRLAAEAHQLVLDPQMRSGRCACGRWAANSDGGSTRSYEGLLAISAMEDEFRRIVANPSFDCPAAAESRRHFLEADHYRTHLAPLGIPEGKIRPTRISS
jgi:hypothetical protein